MPGIIRDCRVPHHGVCHAVLSTATVVATLEQHGVETRLNDAGAVEAWEPATIIPLDGSGVRDASAWIIVPTGVHALAAWLGY